MKRMSGNRVISFAYRSPVLLDVQHIPVRKVQTEDGLCQAFLEKVVVKAVLPSVPLPVIRGQAVEKTHYPS
jgi:hypothetical protein